MKKLLVFILIICLLFASCSAAEQQKEENPGAEKLPEISVIMINVGKGDCLLLTDGRESYLIDTGNDYNFADIAKALKQKEVSSLNGIILTHGHNDHMGSFEAIMRTFNVEEVYYSKIDTITFKEGEVEKIAANSGAKAVAVKDGDEIAMFGKNMLVIAPERLYEDNENNNSLVLRFEYGKTAFLFMSDTEQERERYLLSGKYELDADFLKASHHGKDDANLKEFLAAVNPQHIAVTGNRQDDAESPGIMALQRMKDIGAVVTTSEGDFLYAEYITDGIEIKGSLAEDKTKANERINIEIIDKEAEYVMLKNKMQEDIDISGWTLYSSQGGEMFVFDEGISIEKGQSIVVVSGKNAPKGDYIWSDKNVWKNKKEDICYLFDKDMNIVDFK